MRRRLASIAVIIGLAVVLTACSPPFIGTIGVERNDDGTLTVLIRVCRDYVETLIVDPINSFPNAKNGAPLSDRWESVPNIEFPLSPAVESAADVPFPVDEADLETYVLYRLWAGSREGNAFSGQFGASELAALKPGEVLAGPTRDDEESEYVRDDGRGGTFMIVSRDAFEERAEEFCT
ncbi:hypothetical protein HF576_00700 [Microbacterium sp. CFH 90308]|uniref:Lipoprotein n=1 Tax=Microbacterium salsuginis TaxID=2722803 RepID=A0ABX1K8Q5_9MICO|nr:hypothetical protein [Microbacterium sp. CFH 90308]NLP82358.1 hypothetical protein [Microbacterium sp. CFH 90308]